MSDLQDLIATNAVRAYNEGFERGVASEREHIIELLENPYWHSIQSPDIHIDCEMCKIIELIKGEQE